MTNKQWFTIGFVGILFCVLYFGMGVKPEKMRIVEKSRMENLESTGIQIISREAKKKLSKEDAAFIEMLEVQAKSSPEDSLNNFREDLSSAWFKLGHPAMAGYYAEEIAKEKETEQAWSIAGTSYLYGVKNYKEQKLKDFCSKRAVAALESAISINPDNIDHKINLALGYTDNPPSDNPMMGILQLLDLNKKFPENVKVLNQLGRLGLETNQIAKAVARLEKALSLSPDNEFTICLLAKAYRSANEIEKADQFEKRCALAINKR